MFIWNYQLLSITKSFFAISMLWSFFLTNAYDSRQCICRNLLCHFPYWWTFTLFPIFHIIVIILKHHVWISLEDIFKVLKIIWKERSCLKSATTLAWSFTDLILLTALIMPYCILPRVRQFWVYAPDCNLPAFQMEVCNIDTACYPPGRLLTQRDYFPFLHVFKAFPFEHFVSE